MKHEGGRLWWTFPLFSALMWLSTLLGLLLYWIANGRMQFPSMQMRQDIAFISDVGAFDLKPLFIAGNVVTAVGLNVGITAERWLRHRRRLAPNTSWTQKWLSILGTFAAYVGGAGLILLAVFDTAVYTQLHRVMLAVFIGGYLVSAILICAEYQRLGIHYRGHRLLRWSFWVKLFFIFIELSLAISFGVVQRYDLWDIAAVLEWTVSFIFSFYVLTFFVDLLPALRYKHNHHRQDPGQPPEMTSMDSEQAIANSNGFGYSRAPDNYSGAAHDDAYRPPASSNF